jgi:TatD DNase family protein
MQDIHTHLYWESFDADRQEVIARARAAGVREMLVVGTTIEESKKALLLAGEQSQVFASVGIHPNEFRDGKGVPRDWGKMLTELASDTKAVALGECGLDYSQSHGAITKTEQERQKQAFLEHLALAEKVNLPVIIHCRTTHPETNDAYEDLFCILQAAKVSLPLILHCYMGGTEVTKKFLGLSSVYFSFTANITYPVKKSLLGGQYDFTESVKMIPLERMFTETDCPFLAPQKYRGQRNEPALVKEVLQKISELKNVSFLAAEEQLDSNFRNVFGSLDEREKGE